METKYVYIGKRSDGKLVWHTDLEAMKAIDKVTTVTKKVTVEEFEAAGSLVREINGKIFLGQTDVEKREETNTARIRVLKQQLSETDYVAAKIAEGSATREDYTREIADREAWRQEIRQLESA